MIIQADNSYIAKLKPEKSSYLNYLTYMQITSSKKIE